MYSSSQRAAVALAGSLFAPALSAATLWFSRRRVKEHESSESRAFVFYCGISGVLLGQVMCHTALQSDRLDARVMHACAIAGFVAAYAAETLGRVWSAFPGYVAPADGHAGVDTDSDLDKARMESKSVVRARDVGSEEFSILIFDVQDQGKDTSKRVWVLAALCVALVPVLVMDGVLLVYRAPVSSTMALTACFVVNAAALSMAVYGAMMHAKYHVYEDFVRRGLWRWLLMTVAWCLALVCAALPVLMQVSAAAVAPLVEHWAALCVYGFASGVLLKLAVYFLTRGSLAAAARPASLGIGLLVFLLAAAQSAATGVWL